MRFIVEIAEHHYHKDLDPVAVAKGIELCLESDGSAFGVYGDAKVYPIDKPAPTMIDGLMSMVCQRQELKT